jgi:hypothetical protein
MATARAHKRKQQHRESKNVRSNKHSVRRSIFDEIDKTKEYTIYWLCDSATTFHDYYETSKVKLRGIVDYLQKISDINDIRKTEEQNVFLVMRSASFDKYFSQLVTLNHIRLIYLYEEHDGNKNQKDRNELFVQCSKVSN